MADIKQWEVVQLNPETVKNLAFAGCLFVCEEIKPWGVQGYVQALGTREESGGRAYYRASWEEMVKLENGLVPYRGE